VAEQKENIVSLILKEIKMAYQQKLQVLNTTQIEQQTLH